MPTPTVAAIAVLIAVAAAVRSTWSPCGLSMLSSITPLSERGRGRRYGWTAAWYVLGAILGGASTGVLVAGGAALAGRLVLTPTVVGLIVAVAALVASAIDAEVLGPRLPHRRRQVNELWLNRYRGWVCGVGFGWQIGTGVSTYVMTAGVYLVLVLAVLTRDPLVALGIMVCFGATRGLAVLAVARVTAPAALVLVHQRVDAAREPVRLAVGALQLTVAALAAAITVGVGGAAAIVVVGGAIALASRVRARTTELATVAAVR